MTWWEEVSTAKIIKRPHFHVYKMEILVATLIDTLLWYFVFRVTVQICPIAADLVVYSSHWTFAGELYCATWSLFTHDQASRQFLSTWRMQPGPLASVWKTLSGYLCSKTPCRISCDFAVTAALQLAILSCRILLPHSPMVLIPSALEQTSKIEISPRVGFPSAWTKFPNVVKNI